jgi:hypothetical protein
MHPSTDLVRYQPSITLEIFQKMRQNSSESIVRSLLHQANLFPVHSPIALVPRDLLLKKYTPNVQNRQTATVWRAWQTVKWKTSDYLKSQFITIIRKEYPELDFSEFSTFLQENEIFHLLQNLLCYEGEFIGGESLKGAIEFLSELYAIKSKGIALSTDCIPSSRYYPIISQVQRILADFKKEKIIGKTILIPFVFPKNRQFSTVDHIVLIQISFHKGIPSIYYYDPQAFACDEKFRQNVFKTEASFNLRTELENLLDHYTPSLFGPSITSNSKPQQEDCNNCGVYVLSAILHVLDGGRLEDFKNKDLGHDKISGERKRIGELLLIALHSKYLTTPKVEAKIYEMSDSDDE